MNDTALFLGAGFSKASGLKTTAELARGFLALGPTHATPAAETQALISEVLREFWRRTFGWQGDGQPHPTLEDHFTLLDLAANSGHNLGQYTPRQLRAIRRLSIHRVFDILDQGFTSSSATAGLLQRAATGHNNAVVTTNWDTAAERHLADLAVPYCYGLTVFSADGNCMPSSGLPVLKLHGSSNWMYCDTCRRVFGGGPRDGKTALHAGVLLRSEDLESLAPERLDALAPLPRRASTQTCSFCGCELSTRVATFSYAKALGFFQFQAVWDQALASLRSTRKWVFIGYSLPQADFEIRALLKTAQLSDTQAGAREIVVVAGPGRPVRVQYGSFFGSEAAVYSGYLQGWWSTVCAREDTP